jgi:phosphoribosyl 1,2-cyclic phosphodiesterase
MKVCFWGVRGSFPVPGPSTNRYGGNTSCVQLSPDNGTVLILDAGTGIRRLGKELMTQPAFRGGQGVAHLLISHTHWDHIQGLPFFAPLYVKGNQINIYARQRDVDLADIFCSQTQDPYFPVGLDEVAAQVTYTDLVDGARFNAGGVQVRCTRLNHPFIAIGFRVDADGASVAYISDTAPFSSVVLEHEYIATRPNIEAPPSQPEAVKLEAMKRGVLDLCRGCELVVYDTMFRPDEYRIRPHWGHSCPEHAIEIVQQAGASCLALFHHAPERSDEQVDEELARAQAAARGCRVVAAAEGMELEVGSREAKVISLAPRARPGEGRR